MQTGTQDGFGGGTAPIMRGLGLTLHRGKKGGTKGSNEEGRTGGQTALPHAAAGMKPVATHQD